MTEETLTWIRGNLDRGDLKQIHARLDGVKYETVRAIINGVFFGTNGEVVIAAAMNHISVKLEKAESARKQLKELQKRYRNIK